MSSAPAPRSGTHSAAQAPFPPAKERTLSYPDFFDAVPRVKVLDPLARFLGAATDGLIEYGYIDAVKLAGHSCPTVSAAYGLTRRALGALYGKDLPARGGIRVQFREDRTAGVTGVIANVVSLLTGAAGDTGFKGLGGRFDRRNLLIFSANVTLDIRFTRVDTGLHMDAAARLDRVPADPAMQDLMRLCVSGRGDAADEQRFGALWQDRVRRILVDHADDQDVFLLQPAP